MPEVIDQPELSSSSFAGHGRSQGSTTSHRATNQHTSGIHRASLSAQAQIAIGITTAGVAALVAALLLPQSSATIPVLSGGAGATLIGAMRMLSVWRKRKPRQLDDVMAFIDDELEVHSDGMQSSMDNDDARQWQRLLSPDDERLLQCMEQRLGPHTGTAGDQRWRHVADSLSDGICLTDADGRILEATSSFLAMLRCVDFDTVTGRTLSDIIQCVSAEGASDVSERHERRSQSFTLEMFCGKGIEDGVLRLSRSPLREDTASTIGVWCLRDVTQQKLGDEARNSFVVTATHELRTPLTNLKAYAETLALADDIDVQQQKEFCNIINAEATRLSRFVDELLNLSRMDGGEMSVTRHETDIGRLINETVDHVRPQFQNKSQRFDVSLPPKFPRMSIDKDAVAAALVNLLGNACKYTPAGGLVRFAVELQDDSILIHVEDSGIGIAEDEVRQIFDRFFRSSDPRVRDIEGTGLGLAYVREVARLHSGQLAVHSELNSGSRFTLTLPISQA